MYQKNKLVIFIMCSIIAITLFLSANQILFRGKELTIFFNNQAFIEINNKINNQMLLIKSISEMDSIRNDNIPIQKRALSLRPFHKNYDLLMLALMDRNGNTSSSLEGGLADLSTREYFKKVKKEKKTVISPIIVSATTNDKNIVIVHPMLDGHNNFIGAVFSSIKLSDIFNLKNKYVAANKTYTTHILDSNLNLIDMDSDSSHEVLHLSTLKLKKHLSKNSATNVFFEITDLELHCIAFKKDPVSNWYIVTHLNVSKYFINTWANTLIITFIIIGLFILIFKRFEKNKKNELQPILKSLNEDYLSGLNNRQFLEESIKRKNLTEYESVFILLDIDNFKSINDILGHSMGDLVIKETAEKIKDLFYSDCIVSRMGGDEFVIFIKKYTNEKVILEKLKTLLILMNTTYSNENKKVDISSSIGVTFIKNKDYTYLELYNKTDIALYKAKKSGKNCAYVYSLNSEFLIKAGRP